MALDHVRGLVPDDERRRAVQEAYDAQRTWRRQTMGERAEKVQALGRVLRTNKERYAQAEAQARRQRPSRPP